MNRARAAAAVLAVAACLVANGLHATVIPQAGTVELVFTPGDAVDRRIIAAIEGAHDDIHVLAYAFTHPGIANALVAARARGVDVQVVVDRTEALELPNSVIPDLRRRGVAVWLDPGPGNAHNKVVIVDSRGAGATTITGSYNFTRAAQVRNAENVIIFHRNRDVARVYERYFEKRRAAAQRWTDQGVPPRVPRLPQARPRPAEAPGAPNVERRVP